MLSQLYGESNLRITMPRERKNLCYETYMFGEVG